MQTERAAIENINQRVKQWAVATEVWTGIREPELFFDEVMRVVCALANVILRTHPLRAREHPKVGEQLCNINTYRAARSQRQHPETVSPVWELPLRHQLP